MSPIAEISDQHTLIKFNHLMHDREEIEGTPRDYKFTHVFDIFTDGQSKRWYYGPDGYCHIQGATDSERAAVYQVRNHTLLNQITGVEQSGAVKGGKAR